MKRLRPTSRRTGPSLSYSDGPVLSLWSGPGFSAVASVPTVPRFWLLIVSTRVSVQSFQKIISIFLILVLALFHFNAVSVRNQVEPKALVLEPTLTGI